MTRYIVLLYTDGCYRDPQTVLASSAASAIREVVKASREAGTYVAVPERSFKTVRVLLEQTTTVKLGGSESPAAAA